MADKASLGCYYGAEFQSGKLPERADIEAIPKDHVLSSLKEATRNTKNGEYHKTDHAPDLLASLEVARLCARPRRLSRASMRSWKGWEAQGTDGASVTRASALLRRN